MTKLFLADGIHVGTLHNGVIFLDLRANRYFAIPLEYVQTLNDCLEGFSALNFDGSIARPGIDDSKAIIESLIARRALTRFRERGRPAKPAISKAMRAVPPGRSRETPAKIRFQHITAFAAAYIPVVAGLKCNRLSQIISSLREFHSSVETLSCDGVWDYLLELLEIFRLLRTLVYTAENRCLFNALVLTRFLNQFGMAPRFYIGVHATPFFAHAWVEVGDFVVDDRLESLQGLTPLLVA